MPKSINLDETVKQDEKVEVLIAPQSMRDAGTNEVVGTVSLIKVDVVDYKSKAPTGERLVFVEIVPNAGRKMRIRYKHFDAAHEALNAVLNAADDDDDQDSADRAAQASFDASQETGE